MADGGGLLLVGVGGQGVVMASGVVASALIAGGYDVKQSEVHGMAQRGGVVFSHLRFGSKVASPLLWPGSADAVVAFEWGEALRWLPYLRPGGTLVASVERIVPPASCGDRRTWALSYPAVDGAAAAAWTSDVRLVDARAVAGSLGNARAANSVLLGILSTLLEVPEEVWEAAVAAGVPPRTVDVNLRAFRAGRTADLPAPGTWSPPVPPIVRPAPTIEITPAWCKGCDICVRFCPERCLALNDDLKVVAVHPELCTGCRLCESLCPDFAIEITRPDVPPGQPNGRTPGTPSHPAADAAGAAEAPRTPEAAQGPPDATGATDAEVPTHG